MTLSTIITASEKLTDSERVALIRAVAEKLSWSYGADRVFEGCDSVQQDLDDEVRLMQGDLPVRSPWSTEGRVS